MVRLRPLAGAPPSASPPPLQTLQRMGADALLCPDFWRNPVRLAARPRAVAHLVPDALLFPRDCHRGHSWVGHGRDHPRRNANLLVCGIPQQSNEEYIADIEKGPAHGARLRHARLLVKWPGAPASACPSRPASKTSRPALGSRRRPSPSAQKNSKTRPGRTVGPIVGDGSPAPKMPGASSPGPARPTSPPAACTGRTHQGTTGTVDDGSPGGGRPTAVLLPTAPPHRLVGGAGTSVAPRRPRS